MVIDKEAGRHMRNDGLQTLLNSCAQRGDDLQLRLVGGELKDVKFHEECRRRYIDKRQISRVDCPPDPFSPSKKRKSTLRSQLASFNWDTDCFLCCGQARVDSKHPGRNPVGYIRSGQLMEQRETFRNM
ncbi:hypothetical protein SNE40_003087 [Patella caerulea]|uniref:Uncharacterized protein n=1 Tax=Patella caerulea TaxID=87958 RepID=A0AAN8K905_PATCE